MSLVQLSVEHGQTLEQARAHLEQTVKAATMRFGLLIRQVDWSPDRNRVTLAGPGFTIELSIDAREVHMSADVTGALGALARPLVQGIKQLMSQNFPKRLK